MAKKPVNHIKPKSISVKGARLHNLKNISVEIPHNSLTIITGVSGSGKSSLAFDTIYAEGQRRFVESLSAYARQFLERMNKPDVDSITGLPPAVAIEQKPSGRNPRSTVGTTTEVYDYMRLLFGRIGKTYCVKCGRLIHKDTPDNVVTELKKLESGTKLYLLAPLPRQTRSIQSELDKIVKEGYSRIVLKNTDEILAIEDFKVTKKTEVESVFILIDRIVFDSDAESITRIVDSIEPAFRIGDGRLTVYLPEEKKSLKFSSNYECPDDDIVYQEPEPRLFSFNNPFGACPHCQGFGRTIGIDEDLVIPDRTKSLRSGAVHPFRTPGYAEYQRELILVGARNGIRIDEPVQSLTKEEMEFVWQGREDYQGIDALFKMLEDKSYKLHYRVMLSKYRGYTQCKHCDGSRLRTSARQTYVSGKNIPELVKLPMTSLLNYINTLDLTETEEAIVLQVIKELKWRLQLLVDIGVGYLSLDRLTHTLSGGEMQRINLSTALGSSLVGTLYVLDEPSIGLHPRDTQRLLTILRKLKSIGNTVIIVEHDPEIIRSGDYVIDLGPQAGEFGGEITFTGDTTQLLDSKTSLTGMYLSGRKKIELPSVPAKSNGHKITLINPTQHNLKINKIDFPLGCMVVVTGVSGSGKSTLILDVLYNALKKLRGGFEGSITNLSAVLGYEHINAVELVDQSSIGKSSRSTPVTYIKAFDYIRELFASTPSAVQLGLRPGYFSFNVPGGRCEACEGEGSVTVDMQFLPDVHLECESCKGTRYKKEARSILYNGKSIVDVLDMTVDEALTFFKSTPKLESKLSMLKEVGLGYLRLGQPSNMLSAGESQRIKLSNHLESTDTSHTLFIFDEPTTGLHLDDISRLLKCFRKLVAAGHSIIIIEHNLHVIASSDWIIDLGPEGGDEGGRLVAAGTPLELTKHRDSYTGAALAEFYKTWQ